MRPPKELRKPADQMTPDELGARFAWDLVHPPVAGAGTAIFQALYSVWVGAWLALDIHDLVEGSQTGTEIVNVVVYGVLAVFAVLLAVHRVRTDNRFRAGQLRMVLKIADRNAHATIGLAQQVDEVFRRAD